MDSENQFLLKEIQKGNKDAFSMIFRKYYKDMLLFAGNFIKDKNQCEDIVQNIFLRIWENRRFLEIKTSFRSFLLQSVKNGCLDEIRHSKVVREHQVYTEWLYTISDSDTENYILYSELQFRLAKALSELSPECRIAFEMNRFEGLKYKEIAQKLSVSERTIEVRIGKALMHLREYFSYTILLLIIWLFKNT